MSPTTALFVGLFVLLAGWVLAASAVAVGVEHGLRRYHGEATPVSRSPAAEPRSEGDGGESADDA